MTVLIVLPTLVVYVGALWLTMGHLRRDAQAEIGRAMTRQAANYAARFDGAFREAAAIATTTAGFMEIRPDLAEGDIFAQLRANVRRNPVVYGAAMAFEPGTYKQDETLFCPYVYRRGDTLEQMNIGREVYDWYFDTQWQWWHRPKATGRATWTDPYFDEGAGNVLMVTFSAPFERRGRFRGVTTVDIMLSALDEQVGRAIVDDLDYVILTADGRYVSHADPALIMGASVFERLEAIGRPDVAVVAREIVSGEAGEATLDGWDSPERQWVFYAPIESTGWAFAARLPERVALAGVRTRMTIASIALGVTLLLIVLCIALAAAHITRPIGLLRRKVLQIAGGDLEARVDGVPAGDELGDLAEAFNRMTADLRSHVDRLADEQAAREKIERDLDLARDIQRGLMPTDQPRTPGYEIAGWNQAAEQTGGDYFDWLELPDGRTIFSLADVTGHGIGPALIVAVCRAYMRAAATSPHVDLGEALTRVNDLLHADTPSDRFVTAVVGTLDPAKHQITMISAGQAPILYYEAATGEVHSWRADDLPLGIMDGVSFSETRRIDPRPGDVLVLTTDGFFEWQDAAGEQYGTSRLEAFVRERHDLAPQALIDALHASVLEHAGGTEQADDLTAVVIRRA
jgi:sigma-B regulation protein RsbU (phosphoserine phosphatase)